MQADRMVCLPSYSHRLSQALARRSRLCACCKRRGPRAAAPGLNEGRGTQRARPARASVSGLLRAVSRLSHHVDSSHASSASLLQCQLHHPLPVRSSSCSCMKLSWRCRFLALEARSIRWSSALHRQNSRKTRAGGCSSAGLMREQPTRRRCKRVAHRLRRCIAGSPFTTCHSASAPAPPARSI